MIPDQTITKALFHKSVYLTKKLWEEADRLSDALEQATLGSGIAATVTLSEDEVNAVEAFNEIMQEAGLASGRAQKLLGAALYRIKKYPQLIELQVED